MKNSVMEKFLSFERIENTDEGKLVPQTNLAPSLINSFLNHKKLKNCLFSELWK